MEKELSSGQQAIISQMMELTLTGKGDAETIGALCGRLMELFEPEHRAAISRAMAIERVSLMLGELQRLGYVPRS